MHKLRFEVVSGYGAWPPYPPEEINQICDKINAETALKSNDHDPARVAEVLNALVSKEVQEKYKLRVQEVHGSKLPPSLISEFG